MSSNLKQYVKVRYTRLNNSLEDYRKTNNFGESIRDDIINDHLSRLDEINNIAANFGVKLKTK